MVLRLSCGWFGNDCCCCCFVVVVHEVTAGRGNGKGRRGRRMAGRVREDQSADHRPVTLRGAAIHSPARMHAVSPRQTQGRCPRFVAAVPHRRRLVVDGGRKVGRHLVEDENGTGLHVVMGKVLIVDEGLQLGRQCKEEGRSATSVVVVQRSKEIGHAVQNHEAHLRLRCEQCGQGRVQKFREIVRGGTRLEENAVQYEAATLFVRLTRLWVCSDHLLQALGDLVEIGPAQRNVYGTNAMVVVVVVVVVVGSAAAAVVTIECQVGGRQ